MLHTTLNLILTVCGSTLFTTGAVFAVVRLLLKPIWTTLSVYATSYANGQASIDVRIRNLERLAEEQARITRAVESIKDEIAAQRKSHDNRWGFKKDIYVNLVKATTELSGYFDRLPTAELNRLVESMTPEDKAKIVERENAKAKSFEQAAKEFIVHSNLASLAAAENVAAACQRMLTALGTVDFTSPEFEAQATKAKLSFEALLLDLYTAGRRDLWDLPPPKIEAQGTKHS